MKTQDLKVRLFDELGSTLSIRSSVKHLNLEVKTLHNPSTVVWDFSNIEFVSRSFCDELLAVVDSLKQKDIDSEFVCLNPQIQELFDIVRRKRLQILGALY